MVLHIVFGMLMYLNTKAFTPVKEYLENINKAFERRARLSNMSVLVVEDRGNFSSLKLTDGTLARHLRGKEEAAYLRVEKQFIGGIFFVFKLCKTKYFNKYLNQKINLL